MLRRDDGASRRSKPRLRGWLHLVHHAARAGRRARPHRQGDRPTRTDVAVAIFTATACLMFGTSAMYHLGTLAAARRLRVLRRIDLANIALIIAGTYTPDRRGDPPADPGRGAAVDRVGRRDRSSSCLERGRGDRSTSGSAVALHRDVHRPGLGRGLLVPRAAGTTAASSTSSLILLGGLLYTAGGVVYALKRPALSPRTFGFHELFHACTVAAFACHFVVVARVAC